MAKSADPTARFRTRLDDLTEAKGVSLYDLARQAGVSRETLYRVRKGLGQPTWDTACRVADALGVSVESFR